MSIPVILASKSRPRRDILFSAGISPTIRVSDVDEKAAIEKFASSLGVRVDDLPAEQRVLFLATTKATAVQQMYRSVAAAAHGAQGTQVIARPLEPAALGTENQKQSENAGDSGASKPVVLPFREHPEVTEESLPAVIARNPGLFGLKQGPFILGCDSMFEFDGHVYGKPHDADTARQRLQAMRGKRGTLWTGHTLIDLASGRVEHGVSMAQVNFASYSDADIDAYIATGEPLEVAGSFTLEGMGGAFIESVTGDPHGVIGLSLPLLRTMVARFDVAWPSLWNVNREQLLAANPKNPTAPLENVHQPGDGWIDCACGHRHWGLNGAAGVLLARRDSKTGLVSSVVLQHRSAWSAEGGTWGTPGGAMADGENAVEGALRESYEEANIHPEDIQIVGSYCEDHGPWSYTTVLAFEKPGHTVKPRANDDESIEVGWVPFPQVSSRKLLSAFGHDWPHFAQRLAQISQDLRMQAPSDSQD